jgi:hypothetical protein
MLHRRAVLDGAADLDGALADGEPLAKEVHPADAQGGHLAEPEPGVGEQPDDVAVHRFVSTLLPAAKRWLGCRASGGRRSPAGREGVPVVLPVRDGSPGRPYGPATERYVLYLHHSR